MLRKAGIYLAVAATIVVVSPAAFAKHHHHHHHHYNKYNDWDRGRVNWNAPLRGRYWGGRWWGYGEGACWKWKHGTYRWICG